MELPPGSTPFFAVFFDFPLTFTGNFQLGGISHQMRNFSPGGRSETDTDRFCPPADTAVIRSKKRNTHQGKNGINEALLARFSLVYLNGTKCRNTLRGRRAENDDTSQSHSDNLNLVSAYAPPPGYRRLFQLIASVIVVVATDRRCLARGECPGVHGALGCIGCGTEFLCGFVLHIPAR